MSQDSSEKKEFIFPSIETQIQSYWQANNIFNISVNNRRGHNAKHSEYVFYDGPPFANGLPHYGHLLTGFVKDIFARYHTMLGECVERKFGWDCHGLPAEMEVERELKVTGCIQIKEYGIDRFNEHCRTSVMKYTNEWESYVTRQSRWVDFISSYKTMDIHYMESVIWAFKALYEKGLLYEDFRVMPFSWKCETPLSNFETRLDNSYRSKESKAVTVKFELDSVPEIVKSKFDNVKRTFMMVWTTTPWTLPSNLALAVGSDINYSMIKNGDDVYIIAEQLVDKYTDFFDKL